MAQIGGFFPKPIAQPIEGGGRIALPSGGTFYPPAGEYLVNLGANSVLEIFDPIQGEWHTAMQSSTGGFVSLDGCNYRIRNVTGGVTSASIVITSAGSNGTNGIGTAAATISFAAPAAAGGETASGYLIVGGSISAITVQSGGSNWIQTPQVVLDAPPQGGRQATAIATISGGVVSTITVVDSGGGYLTVPGAYLIPQTNIYQGAPIGGISAGVFPAGGVAYPSNSVPGGLYATDVSGTKLSVGPLTNSGSITGVHLTNNGGGYASGNVVATIAGSVAGGAVTISASQAGANDTSYLQPRVQ